MNIIQNNLVNNSIQTELLGGRNQEWKIINQIIISTNNFIDKKIDAYGLVDNITGNCEALEGRDLYKIVQRIISELEIVVWSYDEDKGLEDYKKLQQQLAYLITG